MPELPLVLAGPILRRVEPRLVTIWMAFSEPQQVELRIWDNIITTQRPQAGAPQAQRLHTPDTPPKHVHTTNTERFGTHLHVALIAYEIPEPLAPLLPNFVYCYDLRFTETTTNTIRDLRSEDFLFDANNPVTNKFSHLAIGMKEGQLPSFALCPTLLEDVVLLHGSCRKMHGIGKDGLAAADHILVQNVQEPKKRPHQLFLTGDQIYADDVPMLLLPHLSRQGAALFGDFVEHITIKDGVTVPATLTNFPGNLRGTITQKWAGMTSDDDDSHLISFSEFAAMYLFSFSNRLWPQVLTELTADISDEKIDLLFDDIVQMIVDSDLMLWEYLMDETERKAFEFPLSDERKQWEKRMKLMFRKELPLILEYRDNLPRVARILANVPVYMIMDDHEVTDDWYITRDWRDKALSKPMGANLMRNGMMGYILFQGWGNDPLAYLSGANFAALEIIRKWAKPGATSGPLQADMDPLDILFGFDGSVPGVRLYYNVPTGPTHTYVLDTRTRRSYETRRGTASLMSPQTLLDQLPETLPNVGAEMVFIVSPAPVLGLAVFEEMIQPLMNVIVSNLFADTEAWALDVAAFERFLERIERYKRVVILSGDVHFGFTIWMDYFRTAGLPATAQTPRSRIVQLVASALKNETDKLGNQHILISGRLQQLQSWAYFPAERLGWKGKILDVQGDISPRNEMRRHREPIVLSPHGWNEGSTVNREPDWSWRLDMVADGRPDTDTPGARPEKIRIDPITPDVGGNPAGYKRVVERHQQIFDRNIARRVVWDSHIGRVQILREGGKLSVEHQFWYRLPDDALDDPPYPYTRHVTSLEPTTAAPPTLS